MLTSIGSSSSSHSAFCFCWSLCGFYVLPAVLPHRDYCEGLRDSLDLVVIGAWYGQGRKTKWYSPFLLAAYNPETEELQSVCRCMSGYTDAFYAEVLHVYTDAFYAEVLYVYTDALYAEVLNVYLDGFMLRCWTSTLMPFMLRSTLMPFMLRYCMSTLMPFMLRCWT